MSGNTLAPSVDMPVYSFRKLNSTDTFLMFRIIGKIGINEVTACFGSNSVKEMLTKVGGKEVTGDVNTALGISVMLEMANVIVGNLPKCEAEIYQLLSSVSNLTVEQVKELDFVTFTEMVLDFVQKDEFRDFVLAVSKRFRSVT